jgi:hypothetical protein
VFDNAPVLAVAPSPKKRLSPLAFAGIVIGAIILSCVFLSVTGLGLKLLQVAPGPPIEGQEGKITVSSGPVAIVAADAAAYDAQIADAQTTDTTGLQARLAQGRVFLVPKGTRVLILAVDGSRYQLRVLEGQHAGKTGFVPLTFVQK